ncbi:MAG: bifunctional 2-C-methyl-D-erythritol 4-phosphate cytidylyltransferase/2-C-methyl-D-erythritol 2,4-cyclodiphosphate synthase [Alphaproteobacteria bacterium]|nr:bifunctional 2-C-methyl-D-erythritol 4-phosphate cytidylyltransferase/2-C-methyl-D-erythritol 2,4-cyclodiphosphate synthase [Alphaproteobacteria bacterium]
MTTCIALIVAAGSGSRFGGSLPKQYCPLAGQTILRRSVLAFLNHPHITGVRVVINPAHRELYDAAVGDLGLPEPVAGGAQRQESVLLGLETLAKDGAPDLVMIHDGARPLVDAATITAVRNALDKSKGAIAAKRVVDTLKKGDGDQIVTTVDRNNLWQAYTPQSFHFAEILKAHRDAAGVNSLTDDASVFEKAGLPVTLVPSNPDNMKITNPEDLDRAARALGQNYGDIRTGTGFDVHRLVPGVEIILCGVKIPHAFRCEGHSDADVALHALVDALLGAMGAGDIGTYFPPSDPQWKGMDSAHFVRHAVKMVSERGGIISNVDLTLICEAPRIGPHREAMVKRLAELLEIDPARVNVKGKTSEKLGFTGRSEGIAAQAVATIRFQG